MGNGVLVLKVCGSSNEAHECNGICEQAQLYGIESGCKCAAGNEELEKILYSNGLFDYVYLSAHENFGGFASEYEKVNMSCQKLSMLLCKSKCMNKDCILMLSCCKGGLIEIAYDIFSICQQINYMHGPRQSLTSADMHICFGIFLYNMEICCVDPVSACETIKQAADQRFSCYDRQEESISLENYNYMHMGV